LTRESKPDRPQEKNEKKKIKGIRKFRIAEKDFRKRRKRGTAWGKTEASSSTAEQRGRSNDLGRAAKPLTSSDRSGKQHQKRPKRGKKRHPLATSDKRKSGKRKEAARCQEKPRKKILLDTKPT